MTKLFMFFVLSPWIMLVDKTDVVTWKNTVHHSLGNAK
jgi:hypothetical protein